MWREGGNKIHIHLEVMMSYLVIYYSIVTSHKLISNQLLSSICTINLKSFRMRGVTYAYV